LRKKEISFVSISPLDRLLNQATQKDDIIARIACDDDKDQIQKDDYEFSFDTTKVNKITC